MSTPRARGEIILAPVLYLVLTGCAQTEPALAQNAAGPVSIVQAGKGSYAAAPPAEAMGEARKALDKQIYVLPEVQNRPIPTNKWYSNLIVDKYAGQLWAFPHQVRANDKGLSFTFPNRWNDSGSDPVSEYSLELLGDGFTPMDARAKDWSDWLISFRLAQGPDRYWDVTLGRGMPYMWLEPTGVAPQLRVGNEATFFSANGEAIMPQTGSSLGVTFGGRSYGIYAPDGTSFEMERGVLSPRFAGAKKFLVICPLNDRGQLATMQKYAYAVPRKTELSWTYDAAKGAVTTKWHVETQPLQGTEKRVWQGWLPHHYRDTVNDLKLDGPKYLTPRGEMRCALGTDFTITYPFQGLPFANPAPKTHGGEHDFNTGRMTDYVTKYATRSEYGEDTYWGGKHLLQMGQYLGMARQMNHADRDQLRDNLKKALVDWFTYEPGEKAHYFARYPKWKALIGFKTSYGSEEFNDQHFHYGYFTAASALLGAEDPQFLQEYGPMVELVARQYANWDRDNPDFPFLRTFDVWEGHSWAGGNSGPTGNNQESSSEAMQSWAGLFWLGQMMGNQEMAACGAMGYAMEARSTQEYWFNQRGGNWSPNWKHKVVGMVWSGGNNYGTYFSGDPAWIWGIQWLPMTPALSYLVEDKAFAKRSFGEMWTARKAKEGEWDFDIIGTALSNVILGQAAQVNPAWAAEQLDELWTKGSKVVTDNDTPGIVYYLTHANLTYGDLVWDSYIDQPLSRIYSHPKTGVTTYLAYNPGTKPVKANVIKAGKRVGSFTVAARSWAVTSKLGP